ncbi:histidine phosphatase family protein [Sulfurospirillum oryzae]|uniref:histidine phosphatase family protein n=1 Tax=Sulfurospirillum oryzae TaxID=2976535 RepID=UPI0021E853D6|nr:histidine phosphatase family protein [Sulfurospirillum oryzae]
MVEKVYLLRHGYIDNGNEKRYLGRTDVPLDALGMEQAEALRDYFKAIPFNAIFTSPLKRCLQTAEVLCNDQDITYQVVEALCEIDMGDWENVLMSDIKLNYPKLYAQRGENLEYFTPPNGESFHDMAVRARRAFDEIIHSTTGTIIIVAHAGVNRMILSHLFGVEINDMFSIIQPYACVNELTWDQQSMQWRYRKVL